MSRHRCMVIRIVVQSDRHADDVHCLTSHSHSARSASIDAAAPQIALSLAMADLECLSIMETNPPIQPILSLPLPSHPSLPSPAYPYSPLSLISSPALPYSAIISLPLNRNPGILPPEHFLQFYIAVGALYRNAGTVLPREQKHVQVLNCGS